jgi:hypothetical protein
MQLVLGGAQGIDNNFPLSKLVLAGTTQGVLKHPVVLSQKPIMNLIRSGLQKAYVL